MLTYVKYAPLFSPSRRLASARYKSVYPGAGRWRHLRRCARDSKMITYGYYAQIISPSLRLASARHKSVYPGAGRWRHLRRCRVPSDSFKIRGKLIRRQLVEKNLGQLFLYASRSKRKRFTIFTSLTPESKSRERILMPGYFCLILFSRPLEMIWLAMQPKGWSEMTAFTPCLA